jgi:hypothetical protein
MGTNSTQAWAILFFIAALTFLGGAMAAGGNLLLIVLFLATASGSAALFIKCKPLEHQHDGSAGKGIVKS